MNNLIVYFWSAMLVLIHTADMELTSYYIGNRWQHEIFPCMRLSICHLGIYPSIWLSRICIYLFLFLCVHYRTCAWVRQVLTLCTILYWAAMLNWLYGQHLHVFQMP